MEILADGIVETKLKEAIMKRIDDGAHNAAIVPPRAADKVYAILQAPGGKDGEQHGQCAGAFGAERFVSSRFGFHGLQEEAQVGNALGGFFPVLL